ncbi:MOSC domain-containing protein [Gallaecimonas mangrovi]|uniref:MOSC domain-containing protein n=1 Tax=Gallaecimonas mangrovi TaxID=2291597 RepID=UPI00300FA1D6
MPKVISVSRSQEHHFSKSPVDTIRLIAGEGIEGDAHRGTTVKHRSRVKVDPSQPNLRQVHLIQAELFEELQDQGFAVAPAALGENMTTAGINLLALPKGAVLTFPIGAAIEITGLRNPCPQIENYQKGLLAAVLGKDDSGNVLRKAGVMAIVKAGGNVNKGDDITLLMPKPPFEKLERV